MSGYHGSSSFCDREEELAQLANWVNGGVPCVIIGIRRLGKTGLIRHLAHHLVDYKVLFIDLQGTESLQGLVEKLADSIALAFPERKNERVWAVLKSLRPSIEFDPYSGLPQISFQFSKPEEIQHTLHNLLSMLNNQDQPTLLAFDEFQQITNYPESNVEGILRSEMQQFTSLCYLFSGSQTHLLSRMFASGTRPFFASVQRLFLEKIDEKVYAHFIQNQFKRHGKTITLDLVNDLLIWTECHTYYTQYFCNQLYLESSSDITSADLNQIKLKILQTSKNDFYLWRDVLAAGQWKLLVAIGKEEALYQPNSQVILKKYNLATPAAVNKALQTLLDKQLVNEFHDSRGNKFYKLADVFMMRFIQYEIK